MDTYGLLPLAARTQTNKFPPANTEQSLATTREIGNLARAMHRCGWILRFRHGELIVSRGDIVLLRATFDGLPTETYFHGRFPIGRLAMMRAEGDLLAEPELLPVAADVVRPADLRWKATRAGTEVKRSSDGSVELYSDDARNTPKQFCDLPKKGFYEVELELDDVLPGGRVLIGPTGTECTTAAAFIGSTSSDDVSCRLVQAADRRTIVDRLPPDISAVRSGTHVWLRLISGCGMVKCYGSADGLHWARFGSIEGEQTGPIGRIGLECLPSGGQSSIRLQRITMREFSHISKLAAAVFVAKAPAMSGANLANMANWLAEVAKRQPAGVDADEWRRACALRTLSGDVPAALGRDLLAALWDDSLLRPMPTQDRVQLLAEMALWTNVWSDADAAAKIAAQYEQLGEKLARDGDPAAWSTAVAALGRSPLWAQGNYPTTLAPLARAELLRSIYAGRADLVRQTLARLRMLNVTDPQIEPLLQWTNDWLAAVAPAAAGESAEAAALPESDEPANTTRAPTPRINRRGGRGMNNGLPANIIVGPGGTLVLNGQVFRGPQVGSMPPLPIGFEPRIEPPTSAH